MKQKNTNIFLLFHCQQTQSLLITLYMLQCNYAFLNCLKLDHSYLTNVNTMTGLVDFDFFLLNVGEAMLSDYGRPFHSTLSLVSVMAW
jgi:hypothetical protein